MKVVIDTNVLISGIFWSGNYSSQVIDAWKNGDFTLIISKEVIEELVETLRDFKIKMPEEMIQEWKEMLTKNSILVESSTRINVVKDDPEDDKFVETAVEGNAEFIITQDKHLLKVKYYQEIKIITPEEFLKILC
ncbi:putative toxin-antitoxin system toxin component, PIN family [Candidatus Woesearchaeota archaeon]|nr:putative toxin-antitoxin system toxin component, PIN family [Candidatus Woesearchaeota archaeon]